MSANTLRDGGRCSAALRRHPVTPSIGVEGYPHGSRTSPPDFHDMMTPLSGRMFGGVGATATEMHLVGAHELVTTTLTEVDSAGR